MGQDLDNPAGRMLVFGINQRAADATLHRHLFATEPEISGNLADLQAAGLDRAVVVWTCERVDVVAAEVEAQAAQAALAEVLARWGGVSAAEVAARAYCHQGEAAVRHVFTVAASLDSEVVGEPQVLGQVKQSHRAAAAAGMTDPALDRLFEAAYSTAKRVRSETALAEQAVSVAAAAIQIARRLHGDLAGCRGLIVGLGEMGEVMAGQLRDAGVGDLVFCHPSEARAEQAARRHQCHYRLWDELPAAMVDADILVSAMGGGRYTISRAMVAAALKKRRRRPIFLIDGTIPGDIEPAVESLEEAFLYTLDDLEAAAREGRATRDEAAKAAWQILTEELARFQRGRAERAALPAVSLLRSHFEAERERVLSQRGLDASAATRLLVKRLLHGPSLALRQAASRDRSEAAELERSVRRLFGPEPGPGGQDGDKEQD